MGFWSLSAQLQLSFGSVSAWFCLSFASIVSLPSASVSSQFYRCLVPQFCLSFIWIPSLFSVPQFCYRDRFTLFLSLFSAQFCLSFISIQSLFTTWLLPQFHLSLSQFYFFYFVAVLIQIRSSDFSAINSLLSIYSALAQFWKCFWKYLGFLSRVVSISKKVTLIPAD